MRRAHDGGVRAVDNDIARNITDNIPLTYDKHVASSLAGLNLGVLLISSSVFKHGRICVNDKILLKNEGLV